MDFESRIPSQGLTVVQRASYDQIIWNFLNLANLKLSAWHQSAQALR